MRKLLLITLTMIYSCAYSQQSNYFLVNLAINESSTLNNNIEAKELLFKKLTKISQKTEGVIIDKYSDYYLVSDVYSSNSQTSSAGFLPIGSYQMNLSLKLIFKSGGKSFKELNFSRKYTVNTENEAANMLINDFAFSELELNDFFLEGNKKMQNFYSENCNLIIKNAKLYQSIGEPEKALAICLTIPSDVPCYNSVSRITKDLYTSLSYKSDYEIFVKAQDFVSKGQYESAFIKLQEISIYSQFYLQSTKLSKQINDFIFNQKELQKRIELAESEQRLKESEIILQQKRNELQQSINQTNIEIANQRNESNRLIAMERNESNRQIANQERENARYIKSMETQSQERRQMIQTAGSLLNSYINRPQPPKYTNFYIIK